MEEKSPRSRGNLYVQVWRLAIPLILANLTLPLLGLVDTAVIGDLSAAHIGSVALGATVFSLLGSGISEVFYHWPRCSSLWRWRYRNRPNLACTISFDRNQFWRPNGVVTGTDYLHGNNSYFSNSRRKSIPSGLHVFPHLGCTGRFGQHCHSWVANWSSES